MQVLLDEAEGLEPPDRYEESHAALLAGMETANDLVFRITFNQVGGTEGDALIEEFTGYFVQQYDLAPPQGQDLFYQDGVEGDV
jgi:hypothetical protein